MDYWAEDPPAFLAYGNIALELGMVLAGETPHSYEAGAGSDIALITEDGQVHHNRLSYDRIEHLPQRLQISFAVP